MDYDLEHFKSVAEQRMKTFNYYAIVVAAAITGSITVLDRCAWQVIVAMGVVQLVIAWIFLLIDIRNSRLVYLARRALRKIEVKAKLPRELRVIRCDHSMSKDVEAHRREMREQWGQEHWLRGMVDQKIPGGATFTMAFNAAFALQVCAGIGLIVAAIWLKGPLASPAH